MTTEVYQRISVLTHDGPREINAWVRGNWATHISITRDDDSYYGWVVTYVPLGRTICEAHRGRSLECAQAFSILFDLAESLPTLTIERDGITPCIEHRRAIHAAVGSRVGAACAS